MLIVVSSFLSISTGRISVCPPSPAALFGSRSDWEAKVQPAEIHRTQPAHPATQTCSQNQMTQVLWSQPSSTNTWGSSRFTFKLEKSRYLTNARGSSSTTFLQALNLHYANAAWLFELRVNGVHSCFEATDPSSTQQCPVDVNIFMSHLLWNSMRSVNVSLNVFST